MNNLHNLTSFQRKIRLIPKSPTAKSDLSFDQGAVVENNGQVLICQEPKKAYDSLLLFTVPHPYYNLPLINAYNSVTVYTLMYSDIEVNGIRYNLEGVNSYSSSNVFHEKDVAKGSSQWGNKFPEELASKLSICFHEEEGYLYYPRKFDTVKVLYRNKTDTTLNVKLIIRPEFKEFTKYIGSDNLNPSYRVDDSGDIIFQLDARDESEDWLEAIVEVKASPTEAEPNGLEYFYIEAFHGLDGYPTNYDHGDYFEIDWGDGSPHYKHVWSDNIGNPNRDFTDYYLMVDHVYPAAGEYNIRLRSSVMMEWVWLQGARRLEKWGKYIGTYIYGLGVPLSWGGDNPFEYFNPVIPEHVSYFQFDGFNGVLEIDIDKFNQYRTQVILDFGNYWSNGYASEIQRPTEDGFLVWGEELATYPQRQINPCDFILFTFSYSELSGDDLRVILYDINQSGDSVSSAKPTEVPHVDYIVDETNKTISFVYDFKTFSAGTYLFKDLVLQFQLDWINNVNSGKINLNVKTFNGVDLRVENNILVEDALQKLSDNSFTVQSRSKITSPFSNSMASLQLSYDPHVDALMIHDGSLFANSSVMGTTRVEIVDRELTRITGAPGSVMDFIRTGIKALETEVITIPDNGIYEYYRKPEDTISVNSTGAIPHDIGLLDTRSTESWYSVQNQFSEINNVISTSLPPTSMLHLENQNGVTISQPHFAYREGTIIPLNMDLLEEGDSIVLVEKWSSIYSGDLLQEHRIISTIQTKINPIDLFIFQMDLNLTGSVAIRIKKDPAMALYMTAEALAPNYDGFSYLNRTWQGDGYPYDIDYDTYIIYKHASPAPVDMIQTIGVYFINADGSAVDPTRIEVTEANLVSIIQKPQWML